MRKALLVIVAVLAIPGAAPAQQRHELADTWERAGISYRNADYQAALAAYDSIYNAGYESDRLYYNMGNTYFKMGNIGKSVLYYNRALVLAPGDEDIKFNLGVANSYVKDKIEPVPEFFLTGWLRSLRHSFSSNTWAVLSLVLLAAVLLGAGFFLEAQRTAIRKAGFYGGIVCAALFVLAISFSVAARSEQLDPKDAVVMRSAVPVKSSPDNSSRDIFVLHEGTRVQIVGSLDHWYEIRIADGNKGWVSSTSIESI